MQRKWIKTFSLTMVAIMAAAPAFAQGAGSSHGAASTSSSDYSGRHTMEGEVTKVDQAKGMLSLKTHEGTLDLHFPPSALSNVKKGDRISVEMALKPSGSASMGGSSTGSSASPATGGSSTKPKSGEKSKY